jgi:hypothetical protein
MAAQLHKQKKKIPNVNVSKVKCVLMFQMLMSQSL